MPGSLDFKRSCGGDCKIRRPVELLDGGVFCEGDADGWGLADTGSAACFRSVPEGFEVIGLTALADDWVAVVGGEGGDADGEGGDADENEEGGIFFANFFRSIRRMASSASR